jgi:hypothetical protein
VIERGMFFGYFVFVLLFACGMHWATHVQRRYKRWTMMTAAATAALPLAWTGQVLLIPNNCNQEDLLPNLYVATCSTLIGVVSAAWLMRTAVTRRVSYCALDVNAAAWGGEDAMVRSGTHIVPWQRVAAQKWAM